MNIEHHTEQMEAMRAEFAKLFMEQLLPKAIDIGLVARGGGQLNGLMHIAWHAFKAGRMSLTATRSDP